MVDSYPQRPAPRDLKHAWTFTFGSGHVLRNGEVHQTGPALGGLPLDRCYVRVFARGEAEARARMLEVFGRKWASVYPPETGQQFTSRYGLHSLFDLYAEDAISGIPLHHCGTPAFPHCAGWHAAEEDRVYKCHDCGWLWPLGTPPLSQRPAECDSCGGELVPVGAGR